jgi:hypothetical protein
MFTAPYNFYFDKEDKVIQMELIELQRDSVLKKNSVMLGCQVSVRISLLAHQFSKII